MLAYEGLEPGDPANCRMVFLARQLDDDTARPCGRCDICAGPWYPPPIPGGSTATGSGPDHGAGAAADRVSSLLDRVGVPIQPRAQWPQGLDRLGVVDESGKTPRGRIPTEHRDRKSTRLNSSHVASSYAVFCLKKKKKRLLAH